MKFFSILTLNLFVILFFYEHNLFAMEYSMLPVEVHAAIVQQAINSPANDGKELADKFVNLTAFSEIDHEHNTLLINKKNTVSLFKGISSEQFFLDAISALESKKRNEKKDVAVSRKFQERIRLFKNGIMGIKEMFKIPTGLANGKTTLENLLNKGLNSNFLFNAERGGPSTAEDKTCLLLESINGAECSQETDLSVIQLLLENHANVDLKVYRNHQSDLTPFFSTQDPKIKSLLRTYRK